MLRTIVQADGRKHQELMKSTMLSHFTGECYTHLSMRKSIVNIFKRDQNFRFSLTEYIALYLYKILIAFFVDCHSRPKLMVCAMNTQHTHL